MDLFQNVLGGFLAAATFAATGRAWRHAKRPFHVAFERENWSEETEKLVADAGFNPSPEASIWVINYDRNDHLARGSEVVFIRPCCLRREVRASRKIGYAVLMTRPRS